MRAAGEISDSLVYERTSKGRLSDENAPDEVADCIGCNLFYFNVRRLSAADSKC